MEKYGFVYIWFDSWRKMFYVGSHWGAENDGYICSSVRMRKAYRRRPNDFRRRTLCKVYTNREDLLEKEHKYLSLIKNEELQKRYYNIRKHKFGHWSSDIDLKKTVSQRISEKTKEAMYRSDVRENYLNGLKTRDMSWRHDPEVLEKKRLSMIGKNVGKDTSKAVEAARLVNTGKKHLAPSIQKEKASKTAKELNNRRLSCVHCGKEGNPGTIGRYHNDRCRAKVA